MGEGDFLWHQLQFETSGWALQHIEHLNNVLAYKLTY